MVAKLGRKSPVHDWLKPDGRLLIEGWTRRGMTQKEICECMGVTEKTYYQWRRSNEEFSQFVKSLKNLRDMADMAVEKSLFDQAIQGNVTAQIFYLKNRQAAHWRDTRKDEISVTQIPQIVDDVPPLPAIGFEVKDEDDDSPDG